MGFKDWYDAQNERSKAQAERNKEARADARADRPYRGAYGVHRLADGEYIYLPRGEFKSVKKRASGAFAEFESGASNSSATVGRVIAGAVLAGPAGAIVGGLFKKQKGRAYVYVTFADGDVAIIDGPIADESKMREFAATINAAARHYSD